jgi:hypothetical protein
MSENIIGSLSFISLRNPVFTSSKVATPVLKVQRLGKPADASNLPELSPKVQPAEPKRIVSELSKFRMETQIPKVIPETPWYDRAVSERFSFSLWCVNTSHSRSATKIEPGTSRGWS